MEFDPRIDYQARISRETEAGFELKYTEFVQKYGSKITFMDFQQAAYCLTGLSAENLVTLVKVSQNDPRYLLPGITPPLPRKLLCPLRIPGGWTVDYFLLRFNDFETFVRSVDLVQYPNSIRWLEAQLENEIRFHEMMAGHQLIKPWKGQVDGNTTPSVVNWEMLQSLKWQ